MKAVILAAGKGARLGALTKALPKPMIIFRGKPILEHNLLMCEQSGSKDICMNLHHLPEKIQSYFGDGSKFGVNITYSYEAELLGTAGALVPFQSHLGEESFYVIYGDNHIDFDLKKLKLFHANSKADISILFHWRDDVSHSGVATFDDDGRIESFIEKPIKPSYEGGWVNAGIYYIDNFKLLGKINQGEDFAKDIFPRLMQSGRKLFGLKTRDDLIAVDTPEMLNFAKDN